jgi:anti-sigma factor RsiW
MIRVTCATGVDYLMEYLEGVLPSDIRVELEGHVSACPRCTAFIAAYRETSRIVRQATEVASMPAQAQRALRNFLATLRHRSNDLERS